MNKTPSTESFASHMLNMGDSFIKTATSLTPTDTFTVLGGFFISYLLLVRIVRYRNQRYMTHLSASYAKDYHRMPYTTAHNITRRLILYEFPFMNALSTQWALVKSYAVPSGTQLLVETRQLSCPNNVGKRAEDTGVILAEILVSGVDSERGSTALAKMNWLHRRYGSKILNRDMISTLCLFVLEPIYWIEKYEWRPMSEPEKVAFFVYWREIAGRMGIQDIPATLDELDRWNEDFLSKHVYYAESNRIVADATLELFSKNLPQFSRPVLKNIAASFLDDRTRVALGWETPHWMYPVVVDAFFWVRAFAIKYLFIPRIVPAFEPDKPDKDGRIYRSQYNFEPWYMSMAERRKLKPKEGEPGHDSKGYLPEELGPLKYEKMSKKPVLEEAEQIREYGRLGGMSGIGCPFRVELKK